MVLNEICKGDWGVNNIELDLCYHNSIMNFKFITAGLPIKQWPDDIEAKRLQIVLQKLPVQVWEAESCVEISIPEPSGQQYSPHPGCCCCCCYCYLLQPWLLIACFLALL